MKQDEFFYKITPDLVLGTIEAAGIELTGHCRQLNSLENRVYDLKREDGAHVVSKFYRPGRWSREQILAEHEFLFELQREEIPACAPLEFSPGESLREVEGIFYALWPRTGGREPDEFSPEQMAMLGRLMGRIHNVGAAKPADMRFQLNAENYALRPLTFLLEKEFIPESLQERYTVAVQETIRFYNELIRDVPQHRIHGDCHPSNLLMGQEGWFFLDFDDFTVGPAVQDFWMLMGGMGDEAAVNREAFLEGYRSFRDFDSAWLKLVEPLRALRYIHYAAWVARRWEDPAFPPAFPHFGSQEYWEKETQDLEEQVQRFGQENPEIAGEVVSQEPEEELTNSDFFWDWEG